MTLTDPINRPYPMVHFFQIWSIFAIWDGTNFNKTHLFLVNFKMRLLFESVHYWRGYGSQKNQMFQLKIFFQSLISLCLPHGGRQLYLVSNAAAIPRAAGWRLAAHAAAPLACRRPFSKSKRRRISERKRQSFTYFLPNCSMPTKNHHHHT